MNGITREHIPDAEPDDFEKLVTERMKEELDKAPAEHRESVAAMLDRASAMIVTMSKTRSKEYVALVQLVVAGKCAHELHKKALKTALEMTAVASPAHLVQALPIAINSEKMHMNYIEAMASQMAGALHLPQDQLDTVTTDAAALLKVALEAA
jgi:hypothetical protein